MTEPERGESAGFEHWLLDAGKRERPSRAVERRMRRGLGLSMFGASAAWAAGSVLALGIAVGLGLSSLAAPEAPLPASQPRALSGAATPAAQEVSPAPSVELPPPFDRAPAADPPVTPRARSLASASAPLSDGVRDEIKLLDQARAALSAGNAEAALATLNRYARRHPTGVLSPEAFALREKALAAASKPNSSR